MTFATRKLLGWVIFDFLLFSVFFGFIVCHEDSPLLLPTSLAAMQGWPDVRDTIIAVLLAAWALPGVKFIVCHVLVNTVAAIAGSLYTGEFLLSRVGEFLKAKLLPYVAIYFALCLLETGSNLTGLSALAWAAIETSLLGDLLDTWERVGLPLPDAIRRLIRKGGTTGPPSGSDVGGVAA